MPQAAVNLTILNFLPDTIVPSVDKKAEAAKR
jgi:hypothetical protein